MMHLYRNWDSKDVYRNVSMQLVQRRHPDWNHTAVEAQAKAEFQTAAM